MVKHLRNIVNIWGNKIDYFKNEENYNFIYLTTVQLAEERGEIVTFCPKFREFGNRVAEIVSETREFADELCKRLTETRKYERVEVKTETVDVPLH